MLHPSNLKSAALGLLAMGLFVVTDISVKFLGGGYDPFQIIWGAIFGAPLFDEVMSLETMIGTTIIILAGLVIVARQHKPA